MTHPKTQTHFFALNALQTTQFHRTFKKFSNQGRNEVRWRPGQEAILTSMFEPELFQKQISVQKKVLVTLLGLSGARGIVPPSLRPCFQCILASNPHSPYF